MTTHADPEGTLARWFAIDADSCFGVFTGAYAAWPCSVFEDYAAVSAADEFLDSAVPVTDGVLSAGYPAGVDPTFPLREAACGLYSFNANLGFGGATIYFLEASPRRPLVVQEAPPVLRRAANLVVLQGLRFADTVQLDLAAWVPTVKGSG